MSEAVIRHADDNDLSAVTRLRREWTQEQEGETGDPAFDERLASWFAHESERRIVWLAEVDGRPVGMMNLAVFERMPRPGRPPSRWGYLGNAFVLSAYRNRGIGTRLINTVLDYADGNGFVRVLLSPTCRSVSFYERAGFGPASALMLRTPPQATDGALGP